MSIFGRFRRSDDHRRLGSEALERGDYSAAVREYEALVVEAPTWSSAWFNLGLAYKMLRDWPNSARSNRRAAELDPTNEPAFWNCGVAATALRDWATARWCWQGIGLEVDAGDGPPDMDFGPNPVRLTTPDNSGETIWGRRIDPCRLRIESVPLPESGHRWGDVILHDVVPHGTRFSQGRTLSVFDELIRMDPSPWPTLESHLTVPSEADSEDLRTRLFDAELGADDWSSMRLLCKTCAEDTVHRTEAPSDAQPYNPNRHFGLAGPGDELERRLAEWAAAGEGRVVGPITEAFVPPAILLN